MGNTAPSGMFAIEMDFAAHDPSLLADAELVDAAVGFERLAGWVAARQAEVLAEFGRRGRGRATDVPVREWVGHEVAMALTVSRGSADVRLAHAALLDGVLRPTRDLLAAGRLDPSRARLICDRLTGLDDAVAAAVQERVLARAPGQTWSQLDAAIRRAVLALDAGGAAARHRRATEQRRVDVFAGEDGTATLWARMTAPDAAASFEWLTRLARGMDADDPRTLDQRRVDLLTAALTGRLLLRDPGAGPDDLVTTTPVTPGKPLITVLVPLSTLTGALLDHGRTTYRPPAALADFVRGRDVTCRAPGCGRPAATCELDHVVPWDPDGTTSEDNLATLCPAHHDLKEQPGWQVVLHDDRQLEWITPTGHHYRTGPHDYR